MVGSVGICTQVDPILGILTTSGMSSSVAYLYNVHWLVNAQASECIYLGFGCKKSIYLTEQPISQSWVNEAHHCI